MNALTPPSPILLKITDRSGAVLFSERFSSLPLALASCARLDPRLLNRAHQIDISNHATSAVPTVFTHGAVLPQWSTPSPALNPVGWDSPWPARTRYAHHGVPPCDHLVERLRRLTHPSQALDAEISHHLAQSDEPLYDAVTASLGSAVHFTGSVEHAAALVPNGYQWVVRSDGMAGCALHSPYGVTPNAASEGATPAIGLCIAALKVHAE